MRYFLICLVFLISCQSQKLPDKWKPLEEIVECFFLPDDVGALTIGNTMYVKSLKDWDDYSEVGKIGHLLHERVHSIRQQRDGTFFWIIKYLTNKHFMAYEEQLAWYVELKYLLENNRIIDIYSMKLELYENFDGKLFKNKKEIKQWVENVKANKWEPEENTKFYLTPLFKE